MSDFSHSCTECGVCVDACPFLAASGTPDKILSGHPEAAFSCTSCRRCDTVCPLHLSPSSEFFKTKERLINEGRIPAEVRKALDSARTFAKTGHRFPFSFYGGAKTVFWPGCGLAANQPKLVRKMCDLLKIQLKQKVGFVLDCCFDPVHTLGDTQTATAALQGIQQRLRDRGVQKVVTGCLNCHKLLSQHLKEIDVVFILEMLPPDIIQSQEKEAIYLHHPCPSSRWDGIRHAACHAAERINQTTSSDIQTPVRKLIATDPLCCGSGGNLTSISPELADRFLGRIAGMAAGRKVVTYCAGCQNRFLKQGMEAVHLLDYAAGTPPRKTVPSPVQQWANRLFLATGEKIKNPKLLILPIIALLVAGGIYLHQQQFFSANALTDLLASHPVLAPLIFLCIYAVAPSLFLPSIPMALAAGFFWGPVWGVVFSIIGATLGSCLPFFLSRYLFQDTVKARISEERWTWLQDKVSQHGWKAVAFTRLIPVFPFNLLNYLFGLTPIAFFQYLWSTLIFMLPGCIAFVAFGSSLGELILHGNIRGVIIGIGIAVGALLIPLAVRPFFRKVGNYKKDGKEV